MTKRTMIAAVIGIVLGGALAIYPLDYYIMKPGSAHDIAEYITVEDGDADDEGTLNLMTIAMMPASPLSYAMAKVLPNRELLKTEDVRYEGEDDEEYNVRQLKMMTDSQFHAKYVAFTLANKPFTVTGDGIFVLSVLDGSAADGVLQAGDEIIAMNDKLIEQAEDVAALLADKKEGDVVTLRIVRDDEELQKDVVLAPLPGEERIGVGITYAGNETIETTPAVTSNAQDIGGPSAGLMFTLEIYNQLVDEDITKGYNVAGTGEMHKDGTVGRIGGAAFKVIAAANDDMDIFFIPDDLTDDMRAQNPKLQSNYEEALEAAKSITTNMQIVPVKTVDDALAYLAQLPPKK